MDFQTYLTKFEELSKEYPDSQTILQSGSYYSDNRVLTPSSEDVELLRDGSIEIEDVITDICFVDPEDDENVIIGEDEIDSHYEDMLSDKVMTKKEIREERKNCVRTCIVIVTG
jgi:hypothetical protein